MEMEPDAAPVSDWTEQFHDKSGSKFWFNPKTGESSWKMPEELRD